MTIKIKTKRKEQTTMNNQDENEIKTETEQQQQQHQIQINVEETALQSSDSISAHLPNQLISPLTPFTPATFQSIPDEEQNDENQREEQLLTLLKQQQQAEFSHSSPFSSFSPNPISPPLFPLSANYDFDTPILQSINNTNDETEIIDNTMLQSLKQDQLQQLTQALTIPSDNQTEEDNTVQALNQHRDQIIAGDQSLQSSPLIAALLLNERSVPGSTVNSIRASKKIHLSKVRHQENSRSGLHSQPVSQPVSRAHSRTNSIKTATVSQRSKIGLNSQKSKRLISRISSQQPGELHDHAKEPGEEEEVEHSIDGADILEHELAATDSAASITLMTFGQKMVDRFDNGIIMIIMTFATIYALFGDDIRLSGTPKSADTTFVVLSCIAFVLFAVEFMVFVLWKDFYRW